MPIGAANGNLKKRSGRLLWSPSHRLTKCACCDLERCQYAIRADACWQELDEDCQPTIPHIWFCADALCDGGSTPLGELGPTAIYVPGFARCYRTDPDEIVLVSELPPGEEELLQPWSDDLDCDHTCTDETCAPEVEDVCDCLCTSYIEATDDPECCMARILEDGSARWWVTFSESREYRVTRNIQSTPDPYCGVGDDDCRENRTCVFYREDLRILPEHEGEYQRVQGCTKSFDIQNRVSVQRLGRQPCATGGFIYACCNVDGVECVDFAPNVWGYADTLAISPPSAVPLNTTGSTDTGVTDTLGACFARHRISITEEGTCDFYQRTYVEETWSYQPEPTPEGIVCLCQEYQVATIVTRYDYHKATDPDTARLCEQCAYVRSLT